MKCKNCGKDLIDTRQKFCSLNCQDEYIENLEKIVRETTKNDPLHTEKLAKSE